MADTYTDKLKWIDEAIAAVDTAIQRLEWTKTGFVSGAADEHLVAARRALTELREKYLARWGEENYKKGKTDAK